MVNQPTLNSARLVEPLTRREQDILKLLALNLTDREIADRLTLALSSVKWYARQVYAKLGVENRHQAVANAAELGLLPRSTASRRAHNLPNLITRLIGREKEIARVVEMVWEYPLITLTGPGGVGKTRLAIAAAEELLDDFANGVWFVEIAPLSDPLLVERTLADVLGVREEPGRSLRDSLVLHLEERQTLLIFDNCEHMLDACAALAADLLKRLPDLKILVSSREPLGVTGEAVYRVPSLTFPHDLKPLALGQIQEFEAVRLFQERARAAFPDFQLDEHSAASVAQICRRLDGIPLAIELAASRIASLNVEQIAARLDQSFRLLSGSSRGALERHRTLRAAVDWSYNLLAEKERLLLRRLSVFVGGCTLEAAESVCQAEGIQQDEILDLLSRLVDKSMLVMEQARTGETRYRLLETIRQYAEEKQDDPLQVEHMRRMHCDWFVQFAERAEPKFLTREYLVWLRKLEADVDNLRAALEWSINQNADPQAGLRIINAIVLDFWSNINYVVEANRWTDKAVNAIINLASVSPLLKIQSLFSKARLNSFLNPPDMHLFDQIFELCQDVGEDAQLERVKSLILLGIALAYQNGDYKIGLDKLCESEAIARGMGEPGKSPLSICLVFQTQLRTSLGDLDGALACLQEGSAYFNDISPNAFSVDLDLNWGTIYYQIGNYEAAESHFKNAIAGQHEVNDPNQLDHSLRKLGDVYRAQRKIEQANSAFFEALQWTIETAQWPHVVLVQCCFAFTAIDQACGLPSEEARLHSLRAARILGTIQPVIAETNAVFPSEYKSEYDRALETLRERLDPADLEAAWAEGRAMNRKQVVAYLQNIDF